MGALMHDDPVLLERKRYEELLEAEARLESLEAAGVDNWSGYDDAMEMYEPPSELA